MERRAEKDTQPNPKVWEEASERPSVVLNLETGEAVDSRTGKPIQPPYHNGEFRKEVAAFSAQEGYKEYAQRILSSKEDWKKAPFDVKLKSFWKSQIEVRHVVIFSGSVLLGVAIYEMGRWLIKPMRKLPGFANYSIEMPTKASAKLR